MKTFAELRCHPALTIQSQSPTHLIGMVTLRDNHLKPITASIIIGQDEDGWEHVSISPFNPAYTPSWDNMTFVKDMVWDGEEEVVQIMPKKSEYVNVKQNCLHLWRKKDGQLWK